MITMRAFARAGIDRVSNRHTRFPENSPAQILEAQSPVSQDVKFGLSNDGPKGNDNFWPLPNISGNENIFAFFRPGLAGQGQNQILKTHLILACENSGESIGLRFEQGDLQYGNPVASDRHFYMHAQLTPEFYSTASGGFMLCLPTCFKSCPAIPVPHLGRYGSWFAALVAVAGHQQDNASSVLKSFENYDAGLSSDNKNIATRDLETTINRLLKLR